ncbi:MAG: magnesium and cobalt transport protein CorA [Mongoliibacter sp.]|uniref:magnesium/cobalt transporter CorA n=1 Tax=Mongoliibacter sp. TaxID=2022438 RepID=UPI0012EF6703|nr:magnesium/cobalt transporter CorA [Mongoliibacter sp.]TVP52612.1 MAG: magnesium and cobalt transport protein CorA [Mongoliibacter sp.]
MNTSEKTNPKLSLELYVYEDDFFEKNHITELSQLIPYLNTPKKFWLNIVSHDENLLSGIAEIFAIHPLALDDIKNKQQRPKLEEFDNFMLLVTKMLYTKSNISNIHSEQVSFIIGKNHLITVQEDEFDIFDGVRIRLENPAGKMRKMGPDYLTYTLLDAIIDEYFILLEKLYDRTEQLEDQVMVNHHKSLLSAIYHHRKSMQEIKKIVWPTREILSAWKKSESPFLKKKTFPYINNIYEHAVEIIENLEMQRESIATLLEIYMTNISLKQNEVMKTLTIIATIFIPLTFIAGIYGMNFEYMPELQWKYAYWVIWAVFLLATAGMITYFKKKKWF